jgi:hypothetical protein
MRPFRSRIKPQHIFLSYVPPPGSFKSICFFVTWGDHVDCPEHFNINLSIDTG